MTKRDLSGLKYDNYLDEKCLIYKVHIKVHLYLQLDAAFLNTTRLFYLKSVFRTLKSPKLEVEAKARGYCTFKITFVLPNAFYFTPHSL
jgi:hypothetical protein